MNPGPLSERPELCRKRYAPVYFSIGIGLGDLGQGKCTSKIVQYPTTHPAYKTLLMLLTFYPFDRLVTDLAGCTIAHFILLRIPLIYHFFVTFYPFDRLVGVTGGK